MARARFSTISTNMLSGSGGSDGGGNTRIRSGRRRRPRDRDHPRGRRTAGDTPDAGAGHYRLPRAATGRAGLSGAAARGVVPLGLPGAAPVSPTPIGGAVLPGTSIPIPGLPGGRRGGKRHPGSGVLRSGRARRG